MANNGGKRSTVKTQKAKKKNNKKGQRKPNTCSYVHPQCDPPPWSLVPQHVAWLCAAVGRNLRQNDGSIFCWFADFRLCDWW